ncbi:eCIS core domain-containing protein, partial [Streptomyces olindensis]|uniref:eCIS core domain-containing protein n=1 Tax=Streptomyces olindensis TaxID=358823 RepID=UPI00341145B1
MSNSRTQDSGSEQSAEQRRRKRKERAAKSRAPEPKDIVGGAGQPLDPGVRRELEERLGHDLSRVRLHTGRDAGRLTELLGADAVAVGQDVFFREGTFMPGTDEGLRLLAHELLHTVQNPHGLGALRAGRELGAVSLPQEGIEREAESAAQDLVRDPEAAAPEIEEGRGTPGWLRYATVDADRRRMEQPDPATLVDRLANTLLRSLRGDPEDRSGRVRIQLARMAPEVQDSVLDRLELRLPAPVVDRLLEGVEETERSGPPPLDAATAPHAVPGAAEEVEEERERAEPEAGNPPERDARQDEPGTGRHEGALGDDREETPSNEADPENAPGGAGSATPAPGGAGTPQQDAAKDEQERSQDQQEEKDASARDTRQDAADERQEASDTEREQQEQDKQDERGAEEDAGGGEDEPAQEPEKQAVEQEQRQDTAAGDVAHRPASSPSAVDRSGTEPGEKSRTGGDTAAARATGDPENEQDSDDEPLGLDAEPAQDGAEQDAGDDTASAAGQEPGPDVDLVGYTDAAKNPNLVEERRKGTAPPPSLSATVDVPAAEPAPQQTESDTPREAASRAEEDSGSETFDSLLSGPTDGQTDPSGSGGELLTASPGVTGGAVMADAAGADRDREHADERKADAEAARRDEEARASDAGAPGATVGPTETTPPDQLAKAGEDARTQGAGSASPSGVPAEGTGRSDTATKPEAGKPDRRTGQTGDGKSTQQQDGKGVDGPVGKSGSDPDQGRTGPEPSAPAGGDVTPGKGPATSPGPATGPDHVSTPGPAAAPRLAPGNGPSPAAAGPEPRTNTPKAAESTGSGGSGSQGPGGTSGGSATSRSRSASGKRQAARQAARTASRRGGGGGARPTLPMMSNVVPLCGPAVR